MTLSFRWTALAVLAALPVIVPTACAQDYSGLGPEQGAQSPSLSSPAQSPVRQGNRPYPRTTPASSYSLTQTNPFYGSIPTGEATPGILRLSLDDVIQRALRQNLGLLLGEQRTRTARSQQLQELSRLLPAITGVASESVAQENLAARGIKFPGVPQTVGPFGFFDARAYLSQPLFDLSALNHERAAVQNLSAAQYSYQDARNFVVFVAAAAYLQALSSASRITDAQAQLETAQALYSQAVDLHKAGLSPAIDSLRSQVQQQSRQQTLVTARNDFAKNKLTLARIIGLPPGQEIELPDSVPYSALDGIVLQDALRRAYTSRPDLKSVAAQVRSAELTRQAAQSERLPTVGVDADYGDIGVNPASSHGTFHVTGSLRIPLFTGGRVRGEVMQAGVMVEQKKSELEDLRGRVDFEIRAAFLDLGAAAEQVRLGSSSMDLAQKALAQSRDRFAAGVADNLEVIQAQEALASANDFYISSLYSYNLAKLTLARVMGVAETEGRQYLEGPPPGGPHLG